MKNNEVKTMQNTVLKYLENTVDKFPDKIAVVDQERKITFNDLKTKAMQIAHNINVRVKQYNQPILIYLPKSVVSIESMIGILYSRNFYTITDVKFPWEKVKGIVNGLAPSLIITDTKYINYLIENGISSELILNIDNMDSIQSIDNLDIGKIIDTDIVYVLFTSGSTGIPKGVIINNRSIIDYIDWLCNTFQIEDSDNIGNQAPFYFDNSTLDVYTMISTGATLYIIPEFLFAFPAKLMSYVVENNISMIFWVPSIMLNISNFDILSKVDAKCLKKILFAGEVMPNKCLNYWRKNIKNAIYANLYGPTEITVDCTYYIVDREFDDSEPLPIGIPCENTDVLLLDEKQNVINDKNQIGELCVRGSSLAMGYWNNKEKTKEVFIQNPLNKMYEEKIYCTGDLAHYNEYGEIMYDGRKDSQIKHMGYRIELGEIELAVNSIEEISDQCVLYDNENKEIVLFYISEKGVDRNTIRKQLANIIPKYMFPTKYVLLENMPHNSNGKIDRTVLKKKYIERG